MRNAFSLVELSIVLVILGLLTGGILAGQSLIRAAELRAVSTEYSRYVAAVQAFRDKYFQLPGDFTKATDFWGTASGGCPNGARSGTQTCNGDGNGDFYAVSHEYFTFWQHLANAGLIEGSYSGVVGPNNPQYHVIPGTNIPRSKLSNTAWTARGINITANPSWFDTNSPRLFEIGAPQTNFWNEGAAFKPEEVWNIDTKMDDGKPGTGKVMAFNWDTCTDATASTQHGTANYLLSVVSVECAVVFPNAF